jgi:hypothetical protein
MKKFGRWCSSLLRFKSTLCLALSAILLLEVREFCENFWSDWRVGAGQLLFRIEILFVSVSTWKFPLASGGQVTVRLLSPKRMGQSAARRRAVVGSPETAGDGEPHSHFRRSALFDQKSRTPKERRNQAEKGSMKETEKNKSNKGDRVGK